MTETSTTYQKAYKFAYWGYVLGEGNTPPRKGSFVFTKDLPIALLVTKRIKGTLTVTPGDGVNRELFQGEYVPAEAMRHGLICALLDSAHSVEIYTP